MNGNELIILVGKDGRPSMKGVYSKMKNNAFLFVRRKFKTKKGKLKEFWRIYKDHNPNTYTKANQIDLGANIVVRWGNRIPMEMNGSIVYNKSEAIERATNKKLCRELFQMNNLACPKLIKFENEATKFPIIARPATHSKGKNFVVLNNIQQFRNHYYANHLNGWYYSEFVDKKQEFRLHIAHGRILNYLEKPKPNDGQIAWNRALNEDPFINVKWSDYNSDVCKLAIQSLSLLGLDFGAVDIMLDKDNKPSLLEVNTAGTLVSSEYSMERYAMYFDWLCKTNQRREHHELKDYKKASNYAWHTYHFEDREPNNE